MAQKAGTADRAIALVTRNQKMVGVTDVMVRSEVKVFGGILTVVTFKNRDDRSLENLVFFDGREDHFFYNPIELSRFLDSIRPIRGVGYVLQELATTGGAASLIAVMIAITICIMAAMGNSIPEILGHALATVLGFYFGSKVTERHDRPA
jgi:hypothetical protein